MESPSFSSKEIDKKTIQSLFSKGRLEIVEVKPGDIILQSFAKKTKQVASEEGYQVTDWTERRFPLSYFYTKKTLQKIRDPKGGRPCTP